LLDADGEEILNARDANSADYSLAVRSPVGPQIRVWSF